MSLALGVALLLTSLTCESATDSGEGPGRVFPSRAKSRESKTHRLRSEDNPSQPTTRHSTGIWPGVVFETEDGQARRFTSRRKLDRALERAFADDRRSRICGCPFSKRARVDRGGCGYVRQHRGRKARKIAWMQVVASHEFGRHRPCWETGGAEYCREVDSEFRAMELDMVNQLPALATVVEARGRTRMAAVEGSRPSWPGCEAELDVTGGSLEPIAEFRGDIARIYLYMFHTYPNALPMTDERLEGLWAWHVADPPSAGERAVAAVVRSYQGAANPFVVHPAASDPRCCRICRVGRPCDGQCIPADRSCARGPGCACTPQGPV